MEEKRGKMAHNVILENRKKMSISGVTDVGAFDEVSVTLTTDEGTLTVKGSGLHINRLNVESGDVDVEGLINAFSYDDRAKSEGGSFLGKLFK